MSVQDPLPGGGSGIPAFGALLGSGRESPEDASSDGDHFQDASGDGDHFQDDLWPPLQAATPERLAAFGEDDNGEDDLWLTPCQQSNLQDVFANPAGRSKEGTTIGLDDSSGGAAWNAAAVGGPLGLLQKSAIEETVEHSYSFGSKEVEPAGEGVKGDPEWTRGGQEQERPEPADDVDSPGQARAKSLAERASAFPPQAMPAELPLDILVVGATGLHSSEWFSNSGKSDPYCTAEINHEPILQTEVVADSLQPVWNCAVQVANYRCGDALTFKVYDKDTFRDDLLGSVTLQASSFCDPGGFDGTVPLQGAGSAEARLKLKISPVWSPPSEFREEVLSGTTDAPAAGAAEEVLPRTEEAPATAAGAEQQEEEEEEEDWEDSEPSDEEFEASSVDERRERPAPDRPRDHEEDAFRGSSATDSDANSDASSEDFEDATAREADAARGPEVLHRESSGSGAEDAESASDSNAGSEDFEDDFEEDECDSASESEGE